MNPLFPTSRRDFLARLETVRELERTDFETYRIVKDGESGQHYLQYTFSHRNLSEVLSNEPGTEHDHFLPLESDDVLGLLFGDQPYRFPEHWRRPYLRSGTDDRLMPFDPSENHDLEQAAKTELALLDKLLAYKQAWQSAGDKEQLTRQLFADLDNVMKNQGDE